MPHVEKLINPQSVHRTFVVVVRSAPAAPHVEPVGFGQSCAKCHYHNHTADSSQEVPLLLFEPKPPPSVVSVSVWGAGVASTSARALARRVGGALGGGGWRHRVMGSGRGWRRLMTLVML